MNASPSTLLLPAHCRWKVVLRSEVTLDSLQLVTFQPQILDVAKRLTVRGVTDVEYEGLVALSNHMLQVMPLDQRVLRVPAPFLESALADVVIDWAGKCEVFCEKNVDRLPFLGLP